ncbi:TIGR02302 family protein [Aestuariivirga sp.]|uniref:TIGR02302 family protein n=1 Tax=Aestuariivirga sp. TaxID=2650926 RepID=UPI0039196793
MPIADDQTETVKPPAAEEARIARKIAAGRLALGFERTWAALHWPLVILGVAAVLVVGGILPLVPYWPRMVLVGLFALSLLWSLRGLVRVGWPTRHEAMRRVEAKSGLPHRPVSGRDDRLADESSDPLQQAIWEEHRLRQLRGMAELKAGLPESSWRDIDPRALRLPVGLALVAALLLGPGDTRSNLADSLSFAAPPAAPALSLDAWLKPPAYTGRPPVLLTSPAMAERLRREPELNVPERSVLSIRISGAKDPKLTFHAFHAPGEGVASAPEVSGFSPKVKSEKGVFQAEVEMARPALVRITDHGSELASWHVSLIPDAPPAVEITEDPIGDSSGMLSAKWKASDDYGVAGITADIYLADEQDEGVGFSDAGIFEFEPPKLPVSLRKASPKEEAGQSKADVAEHPWAGFMVEMTLTASDAAGNSTESAKRVFRLPERQFTRPLARALIEQRRSLILSPDDSNGVAELLDAILTYPEGLIERSGTHIAIAAALSRLRTAEDRQGIDSVIRMLWEIAVNVEDGMLSDAKAELEALRKELERALREGAPPERIAELTQKLREALDRYMQSLMEDMQKRMAQGQQNPAQQMPQQGRMVTPQDLQKMLDMIEKLAQSGANEAAEQLLSELENILRNLQPGMPQQGQMQQGPMSEMMDKLSELMRGQQKLMDDTQRMPQDGMGEEQQPGGEQGQQGQQGMGGLGDRQQGLGQMLQELMEQLGRNGMQAPRAFGEAGKSMQGAEGSLRDGDRDQALGNQGEALAKLREGAQGLARQMMQQMQQQGQGQQNQPGSTGEARGDDRDPLGRPMPNRGEDTGPDRDMLPSELAIQRAREILEMLRQRAGETGLSPLERGYIERLLRGLY